jgi:galactokinase
MTQTHEAMIRMGRRAFGAGWRPGRIATAPGRLELLGNHVDYNGGLVLAAAIDRVIHAIGSEATATEGVIRLLAPDVSPDVETVSVTAPVLADPGSETTPGGYLAGIVQALAEAGLPTRGGQDIVVSGDVPVGFGMSSSAALCVSLTILVSATELEPKRLVAIARRAEHLTGAPVGAMDQSASVAGGVILFDGTTADVTRIDPDLGDHVFAVASSGVHHALTDSAYPVRVQESAEALERITEHGGLDIEHLGEISPEQWRKIRPDSATWLPEVLRRRVDHVVSEVARVREGVAAIEARDWERFGALMTASGRSSATDYEISHPVVEELVAELIKQPGVLGARMMGGGEGGPALALLDRAAVPDVRAAIAASFFERYGLDPDQAFEVCAFGPGARLETLDPS